MASTQPQGRPHMQAWAGSKKQLAGGHGQGLLYIASPAELAVLAIWLLLEPSHLREHAGLTHVWAQ